MRGLNVAGRTIVPLRGVPLVTAGEIRPFAVALAVGDRRPFDQRRFHTLITAHYLDRDGTARPMLAANFGSTLDTLEEMVSNRVDVADQVQALPQGTFLYRADLENLVKEINDTRCEPPPDGPGWPPVGLNDWPPCSADAAQLALEGFNSLLSTPTSQTGMGVRERRKAELEQVMAELGRRAAMHGLSVDRVDMPGKVEDLIQLVKENTKQLRALTEDTIHREYFLPAGIKFRPGRRAKSAQPHPLYSLM